MFEKIGNFIIGLDNAVLFCLIILMVFIIIILAIVSIIVLFLKNHRKISKLSIIRQEDNHYLVWFNNFHNESNTKRKIIDTDLIITGDKKEILRINNPTNVGKYKLSNGFMYQNLKAQENLQGTFNINYFTKSHNIKIKNIFTKDISKNNVVLIKNFSYTPFMRFKKGGYQLNIAIDFSDSKNISKITLLLYKTLDLDEEAARKIEIKKIKNNYKFILKEKYEKEYVCVILRIIIRDKNDKYAPPQLVEEILYFE